MGKGTKESPYTRKDVLRLIKEHGGTAEGLDLSGKYFEERIDLSDLNLVGIILNRALLVGAKFDGSNLSRAKLCKAILWQATFNKYKNKNFANLMNADLSGAALHEAEFIGAFLNNTNFKEANLIKANLTIEKKREPDLHLTDFRGANLLLSDFTGRSFLLTKLEGAYLKMAAIYDAHLEDANWGSYKIGEERGEENRKDLHFAETIYRRLKQWYMNGGRYDIAGNFYYRERRCSTKRLSWRSNFWYRLAFELSNALFGYGERWCNILLWIAGVILFFTLTYFVIGIFFPHLGTLAPNTFLNSLYYSAVSFTALGYGQWAPQPTSWVKGLGAFEAFVGVFMMALLLVTFVRKWTR